MMNRICAIILLSCCTLSALSIKSQTVVQPFNSQACLESIDFSAPLSPKEASLAQASEINIVVMGSMKPLYSWFGHAALFVDLPEGRSLMYDYGVFNTSKPGFFLDFLKGRMLYEVWQSDGNRRLASEEASGRSIAIYHLPLTDSQKMGIIRFLEENAKEGNNHYLYHFYRDNCATRIRDILDHATDGSFKKWADSLSIPRTSYRKETSPILAKNPAICWALNFLQGPVVDKPIGMWESMFLPSNLGNAVGAFFATTPEIIATGSLKTDEGKSLFSILFSPLALSLIFSYVILFSKRSRLWLWMMEGFLLLFGLLSFVLLYAMCLTDLDMVYFNPTILYVNPVFFLVLHQLRKGHFAFSCKMLGILTLLALMTLAVTPIEAMGTHLLMLPFFTASTLRLRIQGEGTIKKGT